MGMQPCVQPRSRATLEAGPLGSTEKGCRLEMVSLRRKHRAVLAGRRGLGVGVQGAFWRRHWCVHVQLGRTPRWTILDLQVT